MADSFDWNKYDVVDDSDSKDAPAATPAAAFNWDDHPIVSDGAAQADASTSPVTAATTGFFDSIPFAKQIGAASGTAMDALTGVAGPLAGGSLDDLIDDYREKRDALRDSFAKAAAAHPVIHAAAGLPAVAAIGDALPGDGAVEQAATYGAASGLSDSDADLTKGEFAPAAWDALSGAATGGVLGQAGETVAPMIGNALVKGGKKLLGATLGPSSEAIDAYLANPGAINNAVDFPTQADNLAQAANDVKDQVSQADSNAWQTLKDKSPLDATDLLQGLGDIQQSLTINGNLVGPANRQAYNKVGGIMDDVQGLGDNLSQGDVKKVIQNLDSNINWDDPSASKTNQALSDARTFLDQQLKNANPDYQAAMQPVADRTKLLQYFKQKYNLKMDPNEGFVPSDATANNLKNSLNDQTKSVSQDALNQVQGYTNYDPLQAAQDFKNAQQFQGSFANGSRRVNTFAATGGGVGGAVGTLLGGPGAGIIGGGIGATVGSWAGAAADKDGGKWAKQVLDASRSQGAQWLSNVVQKSPKLLGRWATTLSAAHARGGNALAATDYVLQQSDPQYREHLDKLKNAGQE